MSNEQKRQPTDPLELEKYLERPEAYQDGLAPEVERLVDSLSRWQFDAELKPRAAFTDKLAHELQVKKRTAAAPETAREPLRSTVRLLVAAALAAVVLLLTYARLYGPPEPEPAASDRTRASQPYTFYLLDAFAATERLVPLDPQTLDDRAGRETVKPGGFFSGDGSTWVDLEYPEGANANSPNLDPEDIWVVVRDLPSGTERNRFHPPVRGLVSGLSENGSQLVLERYPYPPTGWPPAAEWYVMETANGQMLAHIKDEDNACFRQHAQFDPAIRRIYCVVDPMITETSEPEPMRVAVYDVESETKAQERQLPGALIGQRETVLNGQRVTELLEPAVVLSPDGRRLAIVHGDEDKITLLDAGSLSVQRSFSLERSSSSWDLFAPGVAHAAGELTGTIRHAQFGWDGQYLYVFTQEVRMVPGEVPPEQQGLWLVDLERGILTAEALAGYKIQWVLPAPDDTVYVFGTSDDSLGPYEIRPSSPSMLWRLNALTLEIIAEREFTGYRGGRLILDQPTR